MDMVSPSPSTLKMRIVELFWDNMQVKTAQSEIFKPYLTIL